MLVFFLITKKKVTISFDRVQESSTEKESLSKTVLHSKFALQERVFEGKFENTFHLKSKNFDQNHVKFAQAAFSNLIGGIG